MISAAEYRRRMRRAALRRAILWAVVALAIGCPLIVALVAGMVR